MKRIAVLLALCGSAFAADLDLVRIEVRGEAEIKRLDRMGVIINRVDAGHIVAEISGELRQTLANRGFEISVLRENITGVYRENGMKESSGSKYLTYEQYCDSMAALAKDHPDICRLDTLGFSHLNRLLLIMKISDSARIDQAEPEIHFDGNIHGDEKIAWGMCYSMVKYLLNNYSTDPETRRIVDTREIWIAPLYNPDGYAAASRGNGRGVDLNRNWGLMWGNEDACGADFMSEHENRRFMEHFWRHPFVTYVSFHAGTKYISEPWSYTAHLAPPEQNLIRHLSKGYAVYTNYPFGQGAIGMYPLNGGAKDYNYGCGGVIGWSVEVCNEKTPAPESIDVIFANERPAMMYLMHKAGQGIHGNVYDAVHGKQAPLRAMMYVSPADWHSYSNRVNGDFHRFYLPGTYTVTAICPGYEPKTISNVVVPSTGDSSVSIEFGLVPNPKLPVYATEVIGSRFVIRETNKTYPVKALGSHDGQSFQVDNGKWIVLRFGYPIYNVPGNDFTVYRSAGSGAATVRVGNDWSGSWKTAGTATAAADAFDIGSLGIDSARYVRIEATSQFMLDAIEAVQGKTTGTIAADGRPAELAAFESTPAVVRKGRLLQIRIDRPAVIRVFDLRGHTVAVLNVTEHRRQLPMPCLPSGIYYLNIPGAQSGKRIVLAD